MGDPASNSQPEPHEPRARPAGGTEYSWCKAVPTGTGITVLTLLLSKPPDVPLLQTAFDKFQNSNPILRSKLRFDPDGNTFSYITPPSPQTQIQQFDLSSASRILEARSNGHPVDPHHLILEHELNQNTWRDSDSPSHADADLFFANIYALSEARWVVALRFHTSICDRASAVALLRELLQEMSAGGSAGTEREIEKKMEVSLGIEDHIPSGKDRKPFWARGVDMLGYSLNSFRLSQLNFLDIESQRFSQVLRLQMSADETSKLVAGCKTKGIKLCSAIAAASMIAAHASKHLTNSQREKYAAVTLVDCRPILEPILSDNHIGFYHSAILNTHDVTDDEQLWELAIKCYTSFDNAKKNNKHFTDMSDLNFLMCKAIDNPGLTPSSSLRTAFISVFEEPMIDESSEKHQEVGLEDYVGCSSVHGVGPSIAVFDTIRDGRLDCACVYPSPLHSREQMLGLIDGMKKVLVDAGNLVEDGKNFTAS